MKKDEDLFDSPDIEHVNLYLYLIPVFGFFPALWRLYRRPQSREQAVTCRLAVTLALIWLSGYLFLETGARTSEFLTLPLLLMSGVLTSGYFLVSVWLMFRLWQRKPLRLPGISHVAERVVGKRLL